MGFLGFGHRGPCGGYPVQESKGEDRGVHLPVVEEAHELLSRARRYRESGQIARAQQKVRAAMQVVRRGLRQHPGSPFLGRFLCGIYYELRDFNAAETCLEHLVEELLLDPDVDLTEPYTRLGIINWYYRKDVSAAIQYFNLALGAVREDTDPNLASEPHIHLARIYLEINVPERAREHAAQRLHKVRGCKQASILFELVSDDTFLEAGARAVG
jgi:tetratricopeptide (TPR) repeat protein